MKSKPCFINKKLNLIITTYLFILFKITPITPYIPPVAITSYKEQIIQLNNDNPFFTYYYNNTFFNYENTNYEIILQLKNLSVSSNNIYLYIYSTNTFIQNLFELIKFNETSGEFINYQEKILLSNIVDTYSEFSISNGECSKNECYNYYYLLFQKMKKDNNFDNSFLIFNTLDEINLGDNLVPYDETGNYYLRYKNNYIAKTYNFKIEPKIIINSFLHIQLSSSNKNSIFAIQIFDINENKNILYQNNSFNSFSHFIEVNDNTSYFIKFISSNENINEEDNSFSVFFEFTDKNMEFPQSNPKEAKLLNFFVHDKYYFYELINTKDIINNKIFYSLNYYRNKDSLIINNFNDFSLDYLLYTNISLNESVIRNSNYIKNIINDPNNNFINATSFIESINAIIYYKINTVQNPDENFLLILKLFINNSNNDKLKIISAYFRDLPLIELSDEINDSYMKYFFPNNILNNIGYYYIPLKNIYKNKVIYCPYKKTMSIYLNDFDIVDNKIMPTVDDQLLYKILPANETTSPNDVLTIKTFNLNKKYFIQFETINDIIFKNLYIIEFGETQHLNKKVKINSKNITELYFFTVYHFNENLLLDVELVFGDITIEYLNINILPDKNKTINNILPFNYENLDKKIIQYNKPLYIDSSTSIELIKITNNVIYKNTQKTMFYFLKYVLSGVIIENEYYPLYIKADQNYLSPKISNNLVNKNINYQFFIVVYDNNIHYNYSINFNDFQFILDSDSKLKTLNSYNKSLIYYSNTMQMINQNRIKVINWCNQDSLIWIKLGNVDKNSYILCYISQQSLNHQMKSNKLYLLVIDWNEVLNKKEYGLNPYKIIFKLICEGLNKCAGFYYQSLSLEQNSIVDDHLSFPNDIDSIFFEINNQFGEIDLTEELSIEEYNEILLKDDKINNFYTQILQYSGYLSIQFYIEYEYNITKTKNELTSLNFDSSIYSLNLKLAPPSGNKYLSFQIMQCRSNSFLNVSFIHKKSNTTYNLGYNDQESYTKIKAIFQQNIFGFINLEKINNDYNDNDYENDYIINIKNPGKIFMQYFYNNSLITDNFDDTKDEVNYYNINIEKVKKVDNKGLFIVSFDCFLKNSLTNYYILVLLSQGDEEIIRNECQFLDYVNNYTNIINSFYVTPNPNYGNYYSFTDNGVNSRIIKEITLNTYGNYKVYILAEEAESYSLYKFVGIKSYCYIEDSDDEGIDDDGNDEENETENEKISIFLVILIILLLILIIGLIFFITCHFLKGDKIYRMNSFILSINKESELRNLRESDSDNNSINNNINNNKGENNNNDKNNNSQLFVLLSDLDEESKDQEISESPPPPPLPPITAVPEENLIAALAAERNLIQNKEENNKNEEYFTNK